MPCLQIEPLEPRIVLDGAIAVDIAAVVEPAVADNSHVVIIDESLENAQQLQDAIAADTITIGFDSAEDSLTELSSEIYDALEGGKAASLAILTEGKSGQINLVDNQPINTETLSTETMMNFWREVSSYIIPTGTVNILGCNVALTDQGADVLDQLAEILNEGGKSITVNASNDFTGHESLGGDWTLEYSSNSLFEPVNVSEIYFDSEKLSSWEHILPAAPTLSIVDVNGVYNDGNSSVNEGDLGTSTLIFTVGLDSVSSESISFTLESTGGGTATELVDYPAFSLSGTIFAGQLTTNIAVTVNGDTTPESNETIDVLATVSSGTTENAMATGIGVIVNDDPLLVSITKSLSMNDDSESGTQTFDVSLNAPAIQPVSVEVFTTDGTADTTSSTPDFTPIPQGAPQVLTFNIGELSKTVDISILSDSIYEADETYYVNLQNAVGASISPSQSIVEGTINNDDNLFINYIDSHIEINEGDSGVTQASFELSFSAPFQETIILPIQLTDGSGSVSLDLADFPTGAPNGLLTIPGSPTEVPSSVSLTINVLGDQRLEFDETVFIELLTPIAGNSSVGLGIPNTQAELQILNDDTAILTAADVAVEEGDIGFTTATVTVMSSIETDIPIAFEYITSDLVGEAEDNAAPINGIVDFLEADGSVFIAPGENSVTINVEIIGDILFENNENFGVNLRNIGTPDVQFGNDEVTVTILNDDPNPAGQTSIETFTWFDLNKDGVANGSEYGLTGVTVSLLINDGVNSPTVVEQLVTDDTGVILFDNLSVNNHYQLQYELPAAYIDYLFATTENVTGGSNDSDIQATNTSGIFTTDTFSLADGQTITSYDAGWTFGNPSFTGNIGGQAFGDQNYNGLFDWYESYAGSFVNFIPDIEINLYADGLFDLPIASTTPFNNGLYGFYNLPDTGIDITSYRIEYLLHDTDKTFSPQQIGSDPTVDSDPGNTPFSSDFGLVAGITLTGGEVIDDIGVGIVDVYVTTAGTFSTTEGDTNTKILNFQVDVTTRDGDNIEVGHYLPINFGYYTSPKTASAVSDYVNTPSLLSMIPAGQNLLEVPITIIGDKVTESDESFTFTISPFNAINVNVNNNMDDATGVIINDDIPGVTVSPGEIMVSEDGTVASFSVVLNTQPTSNTSITGYISDLSEIRFQNSDPQKVTLHFSPTSWNVPQIVTVVGQADSEADGDQEVRVELDIPYSSTLDPHYQFIYIPDVKVTNVENDVGISIAPTSEVKSERLTTIGMAILLNKIPETDIIFQLIPIDGTAVDGQDYDGSIISGTLVTIEAGTTEQIIDVVIDAIIDDHLIEDTESFTIQVQSLTPNTYFIGTDTYEVVIIDDDSGNVKILIESPNDALVTSEDGTTASFGVSLNKGPDTGEEVVLNITNNDLTEWSVPMHQLTFNSSNYNIPQLVEVTGLDDNLTDGTINGTIDFVSDPLSPSAFDSLEASKQVSNLDNDGWSISDAQIVEGDNGTTYMQFVVSLNVPGDGPGSGSLQVSYQTVDGTATTFEDYTPKEGQVLLGKGETSQTISIEVYGDTWLEPDEFFFVQLVYPSNHVQLIDDIGKGVILNDDTPNLSITDVSKNEGNAGNTPFVFIVSLDQAFSDSVTVDYATQDGTAEDENGEGDYLSKSGTLTFEPGQKDKLIIIDVISDNAIESDETFFINLTNASNASITNNQSIGTILNDDNLPVPTNNAPTLDPTANLSFSSIKASDTTNSGNTVNEILTSSTSPPIANAYNDSDSSFEGIAVTSVDNGNGSWQYRIDGVGSWTAFTNVSTSNAFVLDSNDAIRFVPNQSPSPYVGTSMVAIVGWDSSDGLSSGDTVNISAPGDVGGATAYSLTTLNVSIETASDNQPPILEEASLLLDPILASDPAAMNTGTTIPDILSSAMNDGSPVNPLIIDPDGPGLGVAIVGNLDAPSIGTWMYSIDSGTTFNPVLTTLSESNALLLTAASSNLLKFEPAAGFSGQPDGLLFKAWDQSDGLPNGSTGVDTTATGSTPGSAYTEVNPGQSGEGVTEVAIFSDPNNAGVFTIFWAFDDGPEGIYGRVWDSSSATFLTDSVLLSNNIYGDVALLESGNFLLTTHSTGQNTGVYFEVFSPANLIEIYSGEDFLFGSNKISDAAVILDTDAISWNGGSDAWAISYAIQNSINTNAYETYAYAYYADGEILGIGDPVLLNSYTIEVNEGPPIDPVVVGLDSSTGEFMVAYGEGTNPSTDFAIKGALMDITGADSNGTINTVINGFDISPDATPPRFGTVGTLLGNGNVLFAWNQYSGAVSQDITPIYVREFLPDGTPVDNGYFLSDLTQGLNVKGTPIASFGSDSDYAVAYGSGTITPFDSFALKVNSSEQVGHSVEISAGLDLANEVSRVQGMASLGDGSFLFVLTGCETGNCATGSSNVFITAGELGDADTSFSSNIDPITIQVFEGAQLDITQTITNITAPDQSILSGYDSTLSGDTVTVSVAITNTGDTIANNTTFTDTLPAVFDLSTLTANVIGGGSVSLSAGMSPLGGSLGSIDPGETRVVIYTVSIDDTHVINGANTVFQNMVELSWSNDTLSMAPGYTSDTLNFAVYTAPTVQVSNSSAVMLAPTNVNGTEGTLDVNTLQSQNPMYFTIDFEDLTGYSLYNRNITVDFATISGGGTPATSDTDFLSTSGTVSLNIASGSEQTQVAVAIIADNIVETDETFEVQLSNSSGAEISVMSGTGTGTIINDDTAGFSNDALSPLITNNSGSTTTFNVWLINQPTETVTIEVMTDNAGNGLVSSQSTPTPQNSVTLSFDPDSWGEENALEVTVTGSSSIGSYNITFGNSMSYDPLWQGLTMSSLAAENEGSGLANLVISQTVTNVTAPGYSILTGTVDGTGGPQGDQLQFTVEITNLSSSTNVASDVNYTNFLPLLGDNSSALTVINTPFISSGTVNLSGNELTGSISSIGIGETITLTFDAIVTGSFIPASESVVNNIEVTYDSGTGDRTSNETLTLFNRPELSIADASTVPTTLSNGEGTNSNPVVAAQGTAPTPDASQNQMPFSVTIDSDWSDFNRPISFSVSTSETGTANEGGDYIALNAVEYTFNPSTVPVNGSSIATEVNVVIIADAFVENDETFTVSLDNPEAATIADGSATGTIVDDDDPGVGVSPNSVITSEQQLTDSFVVYLQNPSTDNVVVQITSGDPDEGLLFAPNATNGDTFSTTFATLNAENNWTATITVQGQDDGVPTNLANYSIMLSVPIAGNDPLWQGQTNAVNAYNISVGDAFVDIDQTVVFKNAPGEQILNGDSVVITYTLTNVGDNVATDVNFVEILPGAYISISNITGPATLNGQVLQASLSDLQNNGTNSVTFSFEATIQGTFTDGNSTTVVDSPSVTWSNLNGTTDANPETFTNTIYDVPVLLVQDADSVNGVNRGTEGTTEGFAFQKNTSPTSINTLDFIVTLQDPNIYGSLNRTVSFGYQTVDGTAGSASTGTDADYVALTGGTVQSFTLNELAVGIQPISIVVNADNFVEMDETFTLQLTNLNGVASSGDATGTIVNDDLPLIVIDANPPLATNVIQSISASFFTFLANEPVTGIDVIYSISPSERGTIAENPIIPFESSDWGRDGRVSTLLLGGSEAGAYQVDLGFQSSDPLWADAKFVLNESMAAVTDLDALDSLFITSLPAINLDSSDTNIVIESQEISNATGGEPYASIVTGDAINVTISISNNGGSRAYDVVLTDQLPDGFILNSTPTGTATGITNSPVFTVLDDSSFVADFHNLHPNDLGTVSFQVLVDPDFTGPVEAFQNHVTVDWFNDFLMTDMQENTRDFDIEVYNLPTLMVNTVQQAEGTTPAPDFGTTPFTFTVEIDPNESSFYQGFNRDITFSASSQDGTATGIDATLLGTPAVYEGDYVITSGDYLFNPAIDNITTVMVPVDVIADNFAETNETFTLVIENLVNAVLPQTELNGESIDGEATILNDDGNTQVIISPTTGLVTSINGGQDQFTVVLNGPTNSDVTVPFSTSNANEGLISNTNNSSTTSFSLTFTTDNWSTPQIVTIIGQDDGNLDGSTPYTILTGLTTSNDTFWNGLNPDDVSVTNVGDAEITINQIVTNQSAPHPLEDTIPTDTLEFFVTLRNIGTDPASNLKFTVDVPVGFTIDASSFTSSPEITPTITGQTITGSLNSLDIGSVFTFSYEATADVNITGLSQDFNNTVTANWDGIFTTNLSATNTKVVTVYTPPALQISNSDTVSLEVGGQVTGNTTEGTLNVNTDQSPNNMPFVITIPDEYQVFNRTITFSITTQDGTALSGLDYQALNMMEVTVNLSKVTPANGTISTTVFVPVFADAFVESNETFTVMIDANPIAASIGNGIATGTIINDDTAGFIVTPTSSLVTTATGKTVTFTVSLNNPPELDNVIIPVQSSNTNLGVVDLSSLNFTPSNWNLPQTVTVTGSTTVQGAYDILIGPSQSADGAWDQLPQQNLDLFNAVEAGFTIDQSISNNSGPIDATLNGDLLSFTITLTNNGPETAINTLFSDILPQGVQNIQNAQISDGTNSISITNLSNVFIGTLAPNASRVITFDATMNASAFDAQTLTVDLVNPVQLSWTNLLTNSQSTQTNQESILVYQTPVLEVLSTDHVDNVIGGTEGTSPPDSSTNDMNFVIRLNLPSGANPNAYSTFDRNLSFDFQTIDDGTATETIDFATTLGSTFFNPSVGFTTVSVPILADSIVEANETFTFKVTYDSNSSDAIGTIRNDDFATVIVNPTEGLETDTNGGLASFTVVLSNPPTENVDITFHTSNPDRGLITLDPFGVNPNNSLTLTFSPSSWDQAQSVTLVGQSAQSGSYTIIGNPTSSSDLFWNNLSVDSVMATNDSVGAEGVQITQSVENLTAPNQDAIPGDILEYTIVLEAESSSQNVALLNAIPFGTSYINGTASTTVGTVFLNDNFSYLIGRFGYLQEGTSVTITFQVTVNPIETGFTETISNTPNAFWYNPDDKVFGEDTPQRLETTAFNVPILELSNSSNVSNVVGGTEGTFVTAPQSINNTNMPSNFMNFTLSLRDPQAYSTFNRDITFNVSVLDGTATALDNDFDIGGLLFNSTLNPALTGSTSTLIQLPIIADAFAETDEFFIIYISDLENGRFDDPFPSNSTAIGTIRTDDFALVNVTPTTGLQTLENGGTAVFNVNLTAQPRENVSITLVSERPGEGLLSLNGGATTTDSVVLIYTPLDWYIPQTITVVGQNDNIDQPNPPYEIITESTVSTASNAVWVGLNPQNVSVQNVNDDIAGILVTPSSGLTTSEEGTTAQYMISLTSEPLSNVYVDITSLNPAEGVPDINQVMFTPGSWNIPQIITVIGQDDGIDQGAIPYFIQNLVNNQLTNDATYQGMEADVSLLNIDNDTPFIISPKTVNYYFDQSENYLSYTSGFKGEQLFSEGNPLVEEELDLPDIFADTPSLQEQPIVITPFYAIIEGDEVNIYATVYLTVQPTDVVTIEFTIKGHDPWTQNTFMLTFTPENWAEPQYLELSGVDSPSLDDADTDELKTEVISDDPTYHQIQVPNIIIPPVPSIPIK